MATNYAKYAQLINASTNYARRMKRLSNRIFGEVAIPTNDKSMKVVKMFAARPLHTDETVMHYYPRHVETAALMLRLREYGLFRDEHQDFKEEMRRLRELRGKVKAWSEFKSVLVAKPESVTRSGAATSTRTPSEPALQIAS